MSARFVVVDTSALLDSARPDRPDWAEAFESVLARHEAVTPLRAVFELGNVVHRKHPDAFGQSVEERIGFLSDLLAGIRVLPWGRESITRCARLTESLGITFYDATFLDAAHERTKSILLTQDRKLREAAAVALGDEARALDLNGLTAALRGPDGSP